MLIGTNDCGVDHGVLVVRVLRQSLEKPLPHPALANPYVASAVDADGRVGMDLDSQGVPETFVIDAQGRVRYCHLGPVTAEVWRDKLLPVVRAVQ